MPNFSPTSKKRLSECHDDLQILCNELIMLADITILCGYRGEKEQNEAFDGGFSKVKWPNSKHNQRPSKAVDIALYPVNWNNIAGFKKLRKFVLAQADRLFKDGKMKHKIAVISWDLPHYQIVD